MQVPNYLTSTTFTNSDEEKVFYVCNNKSQKKNDGISHATKI